MPIGQPPIWSPPTPTPKPSGAGPGPWYTDPYLWMNLAGTAGDIWASTSSASQANKTNVKLQREQREWQERMSNSEIQRRKRDYELAGFNPVLAATQGNGASSPSVSAPQVAPTYRGGALQAGLTAATTARAQLDLLKAQTQNVSADTRQKTIITNAMDGDDTTVEGRGRQMDLKTKVVTYEQGKQALANAQLSGQLTGAQLKLVNETMQAHIDMANQMARMGKLDLEATERIAKMFALEANKVGGLAGGFARAVKMFIDLYRSGKR